VRVEKSTLVIFEVKGKCQRRIQACGGASLLLLVAVLGPARSNCGGTAATGGASQAMSNRVWPRTRARTVWNARVKQGGFRRLKTALLNLYRECTPVMVTRFVICLNRARCRRRCYSPLSLTKFSISRLAKNLHFQNPGSSAGLLP